MGYYEAKDRFGNFVYRNPTFQHSRRIDGIPNLIHQFPTELQMLFWNNLVKCDQTISDDVLDWCVESCGAIYYVDPERFWIMFSDPGDVTLFLLKHV